MKDQLEQVDYKHCNYLYSKVPNRRDGWNKHDGRTFPLNLINMMVLINMMAGNSEKFIVLFSQKISKLQYKLINISM